MNKTPTRQLKMPSLSVFKGFLTGNVAVLGDWSGRIDAGFQKEHSQDIYAH